MRSKFEEYTKFIRDQGVYKCSKHDMFFDNRQEMENHLEKHLDEEVEQDG